MRAEEARKISEASALSYDAVCKSITDSARNGFRSALIHEHIQEGVLDRLKKEGFKVGSGVVAETVISWK